MKFNGKNILIVLERGTLAGAERQALGLAKYLSEEKGCKVDLLFTSSNQMTSEFSSFLNRSGIRKTFFYGEPYLILRKEFTLRNLKRLKWSIQYLLKLRNGLIDYSFDVIIPFLNTPSKISFYLYKLLPTVKYTFWHQLGLDTWKFDLTEYIAVKNTPLIIGNAENCLEIFTQRYKLRRGDLHLLPQYVTLEKEYFDSDLIKSRYGISHDKFIFGMISHYRTFKYHELALKVFIELNNKYPDTHLLLMGNAKNDQQASNIYDNLINIVKENDLSTKVTVLSDENVQEILSILDVGMLLSLTEGTPNIVMEYMLYGLPVISSDHPGCKQLLNMSKFLIENNSESQIFENMEKLYHSKIIRNQEAIENTRLIKEYDITNYVLKLEHVLTSVQ